MNEVVRGPEFSWSHSRDRLLEECARAYYWRYYGAHGGWFEGANPEKWLAWRLKHLRSLHSVFGLAIHTLAHHCAKTIRDRRPLPTRDEMAEQVRATLRVACQTTSRQEFLRDPKGYPMLQSVYYRGRHDRAEINAVAAKLDACVAHLHRSPVWQQLQALPPEAVVLLEAHDALEWEGLRVYAGPDLVVLQGGGGCEVVDWKTGRRRGEDGGREQLATYAWFLEKKLALPFVEGGWTARAVYLGEGEEERYVLTRLDLMRAEHRIIERAEKMRAYLADPGSNIPRGRDAFPLLHPAFRFRCEGCSFYELCAREMKRPSPSGSVDSDVPLGATQKSR